MTLKSRLVVGIMLVTALVTGFLVLLLDRRPVVLPLTTRFTTEKIFAGKPVTVQWTVIVYRPRCSGTDYGLWIDSEGNTYDALPEPVPPRKSLVPLEPPAGQAPQTEHRQTYHRQRTVPPDMKPGPATFVDLVDRWCNPVQYWLWPMRDDTVPRVTFEIADDKSR